MTTEPHLFERVATLTGWKDADLAQILGIGRSTVQAVRTGRIPGYLTANQRHALVQALRLYRDQIADAVIELEMLA